ncbi:MAG: glycosyltransferase [Fusobacterium ulcerans]|uniref:glycosyltransferase n=1 Tax=Fusobacterium ulcerans TaxID=861 RepID=UPI003A87BFF2
MNKKTFPLVSIITVCFNSEKTIVDTLESILNQSYRNIEYIVIDGNSKDRTVYIIKSY